MKVGIYFDLRQRHGDGRDPTRLYRFTLEVCEEAERLGIDSIWASEHHGFDDGYLPQPLTFLGMVAARTTRVRLGTAVLLAPLHTPVEIAEQAALVDIVSGGRLDLGLGAGYRVPEFELFGQDITRRYGTTDATVRELRRLWADGAVTPAPVQRPLPLWLGYQGPQGAQRAGRLGTGLLSVNRALLEPYLAGLAEGGHDAATARMSGSIAAAVSDDPERDWPLVAGHIAYQQDSYRRYLVEGTGRPLPRPVDPDKLITRAAHSPGYFWFGPPDDIAARIRTEVAGLPVGTVYLWASVGDMSEELTLRSVRTICTRLAPLLRADT
jgi:alkanesulfonate monooxygenase SsuD/methylene tetrahydromethanopterin reductase-like flavin-dependent oxidoreductase (luciferase family)